MRLFYFIPLLFPFASIAQQNFEGKIRFQRIASVTGDTSEVIMWYGKTKIKTDTYSPEKKDVIQSTYIMDFDKELTVEIDHKRNTYSIDSVWDNREISELLHLTSDTVNISGYRALKNVSTYTTFGFPLTMNVWVPIDLKYTVPEKFREAYKAGGFPADNICWLKMHIIYSSDVIVKKDSVMIDPVEIIPGPVDQSGFTVPSSYTFKENKPGLRLEAVVEEKSPPGPPPPPKPKKAN
jgi:hypothetical protein